MKKNYTKPMFNIDVFSLTQSIAATCPALNRDAELGRPNHWSKENCGWDMGNIIVFVEEDPCSDIQWGEDDPFEGVCYNNPDGGSEIFGS